MRKLKLIPVLLFAATIALSSCGSNEPKENKTELAAITDTVHPYICPMHCENSGSMEPGKCPTCGMDLVKNPDYKGGAVNESTAATPDSSSAKAEESEEK